MSEYNINAITHTTDAILTEMGNMEQRIAHVSNELRGVNNMIESTQKSISEAANRQIQAAGSIELMKQVAELEAQELTIGVLKTQIESCVADFDEDVKILKTSFSNLKVGAAKEIQQTIANLDKHVYEIYDTFYYERIQAPLMNDSVETYLQQNKYYSLCDGARQKGLNNAVSECIDMIQSFIDMRKEFISSLDHYKNRQQLSKAKSLQVPFMIVNKGGYKTASFSGSLTKRSNKHGQFVEEQRFSSLKEDISDNITYYDEEIDYKNIDSKDRKYMTTHALKTLDEKKIYLNKDEKELLKKAFQSLKLEVGGV